MSAQPPRIGPPWGRLGIGWIAAILLVMVLFLVLLGVLTFTPQIILICFALTAMALLL